MYSLWQVRSRLSAASNKNAKQFAGDRLFQVHRLRQMRGRLPSRNDKIHAIKRLCFRRSRFWRGRRFFVRANLLANSLLCAKIQLSAKFVDLCRHKGNRRKILRLDRPKGLICTSFLRILTE